MPLQTVFPAPIFRISRYCRNGKGIGTELMRRMMTKLGAIYAIDLICDKDVRGFYKKFGFRAGQAMMIRNYEVQGL